MGFMISGPFAWPFPSGVASAARVHSPRDCRGQHPSGTVSAHPPHGWGSDGTYP